MKSVRETDFYLLMRQKPGKASASNHCHINAVHALARQVTGYAKCLNTLETPATSKSIKFFLANSFWSGAMFPLQLAAAAIL